MVFAIYFFKKSAWYYGAITVLLTLLVVMVKCIEKLGRAQDSMLQFFIDALRMQSATVLVSLCPIALTLTLFFLLRELITTGQLEAFLLSGGSIRRFIFLWLMFVGCTASTLFLLQEAVMPRCQRETADQVLLGHDSWYCDELGRLLYVLPAEIKSGQSAALLLSVGGDNTSFMQLRQQGSSVRLSAKQEEEPLLIERASLSMLGRRQETASNDSVIALCQRYAAAPPLMQKLYKKQLIDKIIFYLQVFIVALAAALLFFWCFNTPIMRWLLLFVPYCAIMILSGAGYFFTQLGIFSTLFLCLNMLICIILLVLLLRLRA